MMDLEQFLLIKIAEECDEISQRALKAAQFGLDEVQNGQGLSNAERLIGELNDLAGVLSLMKQEDILCFKASSDAVAQKVEKLRKYLALPASLGRVNAISKPKPWHHGNLEEEG